MAIGGFLGGLGNLGAVTRGYEAAQAQEQQLQLAALRQKIFQDQFAEEQRQRQIQQQSSSAAFRLLNDPNSPLAGLANLGGGQQPNYAPGAVQRYNLGPPGGPTAQPTNSQLDLASAAMARGYPPAAAAGMVGSLTGESGKNLDPYALNPTSGAAGMAQWQGPRRAGLMRMPQPFSRGTQQSYFFNELEGPERATGQRMMGETDPRQAARDFTTGFERPGNVSTTGRENAAQAVFQQLDGSRQRQAQDAAISTATAVPPAYAGSLNLPQLAQMIKRQNPGISDEAGMGALVMLHNLLAPDAKAEFQRKLEAYKFGVEESDKALQRQETHDYHQEEIKEREATRQALQGYRDEQEGNIVGAPFRIGDQLLGATRSGDVKKLQLPEGVQIDPEHQPMRIGTSGQGVQLTDSQADFWARVLQGGGALPPGFGRSTAAIGKISQRIGDTGSPEDFVANRSVVKADMASQQSLTRMRDAIVAYERTAIRNFDLALDKVKDIPLSDWGPWLNRWVRDGEVALGDKTMPQYSAALVTAANEYAKILSGSTGAQAATDSSRRETADLISQYYSSGQIKGVIDVAKQEMHNREIELNSQISNIEGAIRGRVSGSPSAAPASPGAGSPHLRYNYDTGRLE